MRNGAERQDCAADRKRRAAREADDSVVADDDPGRGQAVQTQESGHHREGAPDEHRVPVTLTCSGDGQRDRRDGGDSGADRDGAEVDPASDEHLVATDEVQERGRNDSRERCEREHRDATSAHLVCVSARRRCA
jgi:hypothetical protein